MERNRRKWVRPYLNKQETLSNLSKEFILNNYLFKNIMRILENDFEYLVQKIGPSMGKTRCSNEETVLITTRLAIKLTFLMTGESCKSLIFKVPNFNSIL